MTAKQKLLEYVAAMTEEEAEEKLPWIVGSDSDFPAASPEVMAMFRHALKESDEGAPRYTTEEVRRFVGLE